MKRRTTDRTILVTLLGLCIMIECNMFYIPGLSVLNHRSITFASYIAMWAFCVFKRDNYSKIKQYCGFANKFVVIALGLIAVQFVYTLLAVNVEFGTLVRSALSYLRLLAIYPLLYVLEEKGTKAVSRFILVITGVMLLYCLMVAICYNLSGISLNDNLIRPDWTRNNRIRIRSISLFWVMALLSFNQVLAGDSLKERVINAAIVAIVVGNIVFVNQSRIQILAVVAMLAGMLLFQKKEREKQICLWSIALAGAILIVHTKFFQDFLFTFSEQYEDNTTTIRFVIFEDLLNETRRMPAGFFLGCGLRDRIIVNNETRYFIDLGLLGDLLNTGIFAVYMYFAMLLRMLYSYGKIRNTHFEGHTFIIGCVMFMLVGLPGFTVIPESRFFAVPVIMAYAEFYRYQNAE